ncbi:MAG: hypothetical protein IJ106_06420, partial [Parasporobacterium sp.]|nr:hypothetical protein [Parasporobacterium sp.]
GKKEKTEKIRTDRVHRTGNRRPKEEVEEERFSEEVFREEGFPEEEFPARDAVIEAEADRIPEMEITAQMEAIPEEEILLEEEISEEEVLEEAPKKSGRKGFFRSLFGRFAGTKEPVEEETEEEESVEAEDQDAFEEQQEEAAEAAAAETVERLKEFVAKEEETPETEAEAFEAVTAQEPVPEAVEEAAAETVAEAVESVVQEPVPEIVESAVPEIPEAEAAIEEEPAAQEPAPESSEETSEEAAPEAAPESSGEPVEEAVPEAAEEQAPARPKADPAADNAAAAALELFRKQSAREDVEKDLESFIHVEEEPTVRKERPAKKESMAVREPEEEIPKVMRGNKGYRGSKAVRGNKKEKVKVVPDLFTEEKKSQDLQRNRTKEVEAEERSTKEYVKSRRRTRKQEKDPKEAALFGAELFAETMAPELDELLNTTVKEQKTVPSDPISQEDLNQLLSSSIITDKEVPVKKKISEPEKKLNVSQSGEFDLEGFISKDHTKTQTRKLSFDELFGGEYRPKVQLPEKAEPDSEKAAAGSRYRLSQEQRKTLGEFLLIDGMEEIICDAADSLIAKKKAGDETGGHLIVTGDSKSGKTYLTIEVLKAVNQEIGHGNSRVAKVQAQALNGKNISKVLAKVQDSDLIIENIGRLEDATVRNILRAVRSSKAPTMVILEGSKLAADTLIRNFPELSKVFRTRIDIGEFTLTQWADIAQKYAKNLGYSVEGPALLALHARIDGINTPDIKLGLSQVKKIVDEAIEKSEKKSPSKLFSAFTRKNEDLLIPLTEECFM